MEQNRTEAQAYNWLLAIHMIKLAVPQPINAQPPDMYAQNE
jgi:hypothetical protein